MNHSIVFSIWRQHYIGVVKPITKFPIVGAFLFTTTGIFYPLTFNGFFRRASYSERFKNYEKTV